MTTKQYRIRGRIRRTIEAANRVDGRGQVTRLIYHSNGITGLAVREIDHYLDGCQFRVVTSGVIFLDKLRVLLP